MRRPDQKQWNDFVKQYISTDGNSNVKLDFNQLSRYAGVPYFEYLRVAWVATKEHFTEEEFCKINGNVPIKFFEKNVHDSDITKSLEVMVSLNNE